MFSFWFSDENNEVLKKYAGLWYVIKNEIETINEGKKGEYDIDFMKIKFDTYDNLPLNKTLKYSILTLISRQSKNWFLLKFYNNAWAFGGVRK